ncbi:M20/M25/M40 family metallo-hydrolase [Rubinisphaera margarita]|uniref:M20/M25/M40 family metallo-hydrolase n=1 Tax=Rubinisphaera margarita TaxID=2909586 RepID=UPI001EE802F9|nr:M20/M25/M40 family metallo-hydrolase [Rubinisphaera margarita]MCG6156198.1 M20/M25/M40 family metallo-hydrolase [Rubinisphaera margarita]
MFNRFLPAVCIVCLSVLLTPFTATAADAMEAHRLEEQRILEELSYFAADAMEGRDTGSEQLVECANYLRSELQKLGYAFPANEDDGYQEFSISAPPEQGPANQLKVSGADQLEWMNDRDYRVCAFGGSGAFAGPLVFCGYGIDDAENNFDEFANVDLKGKVAVIMRRVPRQTEHGSLYVGKNGTIDVNRAGLRTKFTNARERGAVAVLFVNDPHSVKKDEKDELFEFGYGGGGKPEEIPIFQITVAAADLLLKATMGHSLEDIESAIDRTMQPLSQDLKGVRIEGTADLDFSSTRTGNVVAVLEPRDADLRETIVVGAHYDHVGWGKYGSLAPGTRAIHNGADDNASGSVALLSLARRLAEKSGRLDRRIVLIWFAAEERGLLGSKHYVDAPLYPLSDTIAMINLDMVGRMCDEKLTVFGVGSSDVWNPWLDKIEQETELNFFREKKALGPSDHAPFYEKQIPVLHLFTGLHGDYHRPTDDVEEINTQGMRRVVDVLEELTLNLANARKRPNYIENKKWIQVGRHAGGRPFVGIIPDLYASVDGLVVQDVAEDSPTETAGLQRGDVIVAAGGQPIRTRADFWNLIDRHSPKETIPLEFQREGTRMSVEIKLGSPR